MGDIHGRLDLLRALLTRIESDTAERGPADVRLLFLGDYIDRGPDSPGVLDLLMTKPSWADSLTCLRGNHENALLTFLVDPLAVRYWLDWGGMATMRAYGVSPTDDLEELSRGLGERVPERHRDFLRHMPITQTLGDYFFVHAGVDPDLPFAEQDEITLTTIREPFLGCWRRLEKMVVHGHTISTEPEFLSWRIGIDTGAYASGRLTALGLERDKRWILST